MAKTKRVVVWGDEDVLGVSIEMFLTTKTDWKVYRVSNKEELDCLIQTVIHRKPDIILIQQGSQDFPPDLLQQLLNDYPDIKVIMIGLETNLMDVYSKHKVFAKDQQDLIRVIETELYPHTI